MKMINVRTGADAKAYLARHDHYVEVARNTARVVFGQLWMQDPDVGLIMRAYYQDEVEAALNNAFPLAALFK